MTRFLSFILVTFFFISCQKKDQSSSFTADPELLKSAQEIFEALPASIIDQKSKSDLIALGEKLYFEKRLSINNTISCNSCHMLDKFGVDNEPTSPGHEGKRGDRNSPTVYNAALHLAQFWDGRSQDVEEQALGPILNPVEMGMPSEAAALAKINGDQEYIAMFKKAFPGQAGAFSYKNIGVAIGAFERTLLTPSRFDDFLKGDRTALNAAEARGLQTFMDKGCISCHNGVAIGGNSYQKLGLVEEYETEDLGRYNVTKEEDDKKVFKVPGLRNVVETAPYFHDGSIKTLDEAIKLMAKHQLGESVNDTEVADIKAFLGSLNAKKLPY